MGDGVHQADAPRVAAVFADLLEAAELEVGAAPGLVPSQPGLLVLPGLRLEMRAQFLVQIRVDGAAIQQRSRPKQEIGEHTPPTRAGARSPRPPSSSARRSAPLAAACGRVP